MNKFLIALSLSACLAGLGCGKKSADEILTEKLLEKSLEKDGGTAKVDLSGGKMSFTTTDENGKKSTLSFSDEEMTIQDNDGKSTFATGTAAKIPDTFPKDVFVYTGCEILSAMTLPEGFTLLLKSNDPINKIASEYKSVMTSKGWKEESTLTMEDQSILVYKKDSRTVSLVVNADEESSQIALTVASEAK